ncbi:MAG: hypothetical protein ACRD1E_11010 [Terriglobales bacterium]
MPDLSTLVALALLAAAATTLLHEGVGHGGACLLAGGHNLLISTVSEECSVDNLWIAAAGTLVNLAAGLIAGGWMARVQRAARLRYFLWLLAAFNWLTGAGYWLFSGVANLGDWAQVLAGHQPAWLWHTAMAVGGALVYFGFVWLLARGLRPFLPAGLDRVAQARRLMLVPYFTYGVLAVAAGALNPLGAVLIVESAAAASFGGASGLCWGWQFVHGGYFARASAGARPLRLARSRGWIAAAAVATIAFIALVGPGLRP